MSDTEIQQETVAEETDEQDIQAAHVKAEYDVNTKVAVASTSVVDRQGEIIDQSGWELKNFKKNPVLLWGHDHAQPAIGTAKNIKIEGEGKKAQLTFTPIFHGITELSKAIKALFEGTDDSGPVLNSFSVGFQPIESEGNTYTKSELLEISAVNVPANPEARMMAMKALKGVVDDKIARGIVGGMEEDLKTEDSDLHVLIEAINKNIDDLNEKYDDVVKGLKHLNPQGRDRQVTAKRLESSKIVAKAADKMLSRNPEQVQAKIVKRAAEKLIVSLKKDI